MSSEAAPTSIDQILERAILGSEAAIRELLGAFLSTELFVPERYQATPLSDAPQYPNDFVNVLGVRDTNRNVVPVFAAAEYIQEWCGNELSYKKLTGSALLALIPEGWWLCLNPGRNPEKEFSPWEIEQLREGPEGINAVVSEILASEYSEPVKVEELPESEFSALKKELLDFAPNHAEILKLYLARQTSKDENDRESTTLLIGALLSLNDDDALEDMRSELQAIVGRHTIGTELPKFLIGGGGVESLVLGPFKGLPPLYSTSKDTSHTYNESELGGSLSKGKSLISKLLSTFRGK